MGRRVDLVDILFLQSKIHLNINMIVSYMTEDFQSNTVIYFIITIF